MTMPKVLTISLPQHFCNRKNNIGLRKMLIQECKASYEVPKRELEDTCEHFRGRGCVDVLRLLHNLVRQRSHLGLERFIESSIKRATALKPSTRWCEEVSSAVTDRTTHRTLESLYKMQIVKVGKVEICVASPRSRDDIWRQETASMQMKVVGLKTSRAEKKRFSFQSEKSRRGQTSKRNSEPRKVEWKRQTIIPRTTATEETAHVGSRKTKFHLKMRAHSSMSQTRKAKGRSNLAHFHPTGSSHRNSKGDGKGSVAEMQQEHQHSRVKVRQAKQPDYFAFTSSKEVAK